MNQSLTQHIYLIRNAANGKVYVGKTEKPVNKRFSEHKRNALRGGKNRLSQAIRKHGPDSFHVLTIETVNHDLASARESFWVAHYKSKLYAHGYNMTDGGEGTPGVLMTPERIAKQRASQQARFSFMSDEDKAALTKAANDAKRGKMEKPSNKKEAQLKRWANVSPQERFEHGISSRAGMTEEGKNKSLSSLKTAFSPVRTKGYKQEITKCPKCGKEGGAAAMKRYHFDRCKF